LSAIGLRQSGNDISMFCFYRSLHGYTGPSWWGKEKCHHKIELPAKWSNG